MSFESSPSDALGNLFEDVNSPNDFPLIGDSEDEQTLSSLPSFTGDDFMLSDELSFEPLTDCSTSVTIPAASRSRVRRLDSPGACNNPAKAADPSFSGNSPAIDDADLMDLQSTFFDRDTVQVLNKGNPNLNLNCHFTTLGILSWGVCPSPDPQNMQVSDEEPLPSTWGTFEVWHLDYCTLSKLETRICDFEGNIELIFISLQYQATRQVAQAPTRAFIVVKPLFSFRKRHMG